MTLSLRKSLGRFPRSVEMITHRPVIGSFRNSGNAILLEKAPGHPRRASSQGDHKLYRVWRSREDAPAGHLHLRAERILVQPDDRRLPWTIIDCHHVKPARTFAYVTFGKKSLRGANHHVLLFPCNAKLRQRLQIIPDRARSDFHKCQRLAIVTDEVNFAFNAAR